MLQKVLTGFYSLTSQYFPVVVGAPLLYRNCGYFWKMEKMCLLFCVLPHEELVIAVLLPLLHPTVHLVVPCGIAIASPGIAQQL